MDILHEVTGHSSRSYFRRDLPVTVGFNLRLDVADRGTEVCDTETRSGLVRGDSLATGKEVDHTALLGKSIV